MDRQCLGNSRPPHRGSTECALSLPNEAKLLTLLNVPASLFNFGLFLLVLPFTGRFACPAVNSTTSTSTKALLTPVRVGDIMPASILLDDQSGKGGRGGTFSLSFRLCLLRRRASAASRSCKRTSSGRRDQVCFSAWWRLPQRSIRSSGSLFRCSSWN